MPFGPLTSAISVQAFSPSLPVGITSDLLSVATALPSFEGIAALKSVDKTRVVS
jgi:hypothetical protein